MVTIQELLTTSQGTQGQLLIERKIYDTLWEAVEKKLLPRELLAIYIGPAGIPGSSVDVDTVDADSMKVQKIAEGAEIPIDVAGYTSANLKPEKYGVRPLVTKEMMEDGKWNLIEHNIKLAGIEMAENESSLIITDALDSAANTVAGGAAVTIGNLTRAMQYLEDSDFTPTDLIMGPEVANDIRNIDTFVEADKQGSTEMMSKGFIGTIYGMNVWVISGNIITSTTAYVIDRNHAVVLAEKRPVSVEQYDDVTHDMSGAVVTQRLKVSALRTSAIAKITSS